MSDEAGQKPAWAERIEARMAEMERQEADPAWRADREKSTALAEARRRGAALAELERLGVPLKDIAPIRAEAIRETDAVKALDGSWRLLALSGGPGSGKTTAGTLWLWRYVDAAVKQADVYQPNQRLPIVFTTAVRLSRWQRYDSTKMETLLSADRVVVDDLGAEYLDEKGFYLSLLDELVNERYANLKPTLLTTNLDVIAFRARYGERIADRIRECGRFVSVGEKSLRRKDAA